MLELQDICIIAQLLEVKDHYKKGKDQFRIKACLWRSVVGHSDVQRNGLDTMCVQQPLGILLKCTSSCKLL